MTKMTLRGVVTALGIAVVLTASAACRPRVPAEADTSEGDVPALAYRTDSLELVLMLDRPARAAHPVSVASANGTPAASLGVIGADHTEARFVVSRRHLAPDGGLTLTLGESGGEALEGWVYLLPRPTAPADEPDVRDASALRARSLAYARLVGPGDGQTLRLGLRSHDLAGRVDEDGDLTALRLDGVPLPGAGGSTVVPGDLTMRSLREAEGGTRVEWLHEGANPLRLTIEPDGDRLRYTYEYEVVESLDRAVPVTTRFSLPGGFASLESLSWRRWSRWRGNRTPQYRADADPDDAPVSFSQHPFLVARGADGAYIGILDQQASSLFGRANEAVDAFDVEMWLWPRTVGQTYRWTFDVLAGYERYANAFLRALEPYTADNRSDFGGGAHGPLGVLDSVEAARRAYANGVRAVYLHAWFTRNGLYFVSERPMDEPYTSIWGDTYTYERVGEQVRNGQAGGLKVYVYLQFAGVSEDIAERFAPSIVETGDTIAAGHDGGIFGAPWIDNLWANPDPDGPYGRSFLEQMERVIEVFEPDGIYLDRIDRLDFTYASGYDYGSFDGHASPRLPDARPMPASSITHQGVAMYHRMRAIADAHGVELWSNLPTTVPAFSVSDLTMIDQPMTPWSLFFMRAGSNGRPLIIMERTDHARLPTEEKCRDNKLVSRLSRSHPILSRNGESPDLCPRPLEESYANPRLQYVIPTDDPYPAYWLFEDGTAAFRFTEAGSSAGERYAGSTFIPLGRDDP